MQQPFQAFARRCAGTCGPSGDGVKARSAGIAHYKR
jgi:hypothetical protein